MSPENDVRRVAVISGAGAGIGRSLALQLAKKGLRLAVSDVNREAVEETARLCVGSGATAHADMVDVSDWEAVKNHSEDVAARFGRIDLVLAVAAVMHTGDVLSTEPDDVRLVLNVNVMGAFHVARAFLPQLIASGQGRLVFVSSAFGLMAAPNYAAYCASKFAVRALAESLQQEMALARNDVTVSCAYPGGVRTDIMRRGSFAAGIDRAAVEEAFDSKIARMTPDDAAAAILRGVERGRHRIVIGRDARAVSVFVRVTGGTYPGLIVKAVRATRTSNTRRRITTQDDVMAPGVQGRR